MPGKGNTLRSATARMAMAQAADRRRKAWEYYRSGGSCRSIAEKLGVSREAVRKYIRGTLDRLKADDLKDAGEYRRVELENLHDLLLTFRPRALQGDLKAAQLVITISERKSRLLGLDAPTKIAPTSPEGDRPYSAMSDAEVAGEIRRLALEIHVQEGSSPEGETPVDVPGDKSVHVPPGKSREGG